MPQPNALRVVVWITLSSTLLGALFAFAENRPHGIADFVNTELHGVLAGGLNGGHLSSLEILAWSPSQPLSALVGRGGSSTQSPRTRRSWQPARVDPQPAAHDPEMTFDERQTSKTLESPETLAICGCDPTHWSLRCPTRSSAGALQPHCLRRQSWVMRRCLGPALLATYVSNNSCAMLGTLAFGPGRTDNPGPKAAATSVTR
jgi:hypothetical protein